MGKRIAALAACMVATAATAADWTLVDIGTLGGPGSYGAAVNNDGTVVGCADVLPAGAHAFAWKDGVMRDLGLASDAEGSSCALAINDQGMIAGRSATREVVIWNGAAITRLGVQGDVGGINRFGVLVGTYEAGGGMTRAFRYSAGRLTPLGTAGAYSAAHSVNAKGEIVGTLNGRATVFTSGVRDLGSGAARSINDRGMIVGDVANEFGQPTPFLYRGAMSSLAGAPSYASAVAINDRGQVVGSGEGVYGWLVDNGRYTRLADIPAVIEKGWRHLEPRGINDHGAIVGTASDPQGNLRAFLLVPKLAADSKPLRLGK
jgi:probable HAF family extracellular repeat protein